MMCELCNRANATVSIQREVDGQSSTVHVCETCARQVSDGPTGSDSPMAPLIDLLFSVGLDAGARSGARGEAACSSCGMTRTTFRERQRLGCPDCYEALGHDVRSMIREMQGGERHLGKVPARRRQGNEIALLERKLNQAVADQRFEDAAMLRDRIHALRDTPDIGKASVCRREKENP